MTNQEFGPNDNSNVRRKLPHAGGSNVPPEVRERPVHEFDNTPLDEAERMGYLEAPDAVPENLTKEEMDAVREYRARKAAETHETRGMSGKTKGTIAGLAAAAVAVGAFGASKVFGGNSDNEGAPNADPTRPTASAPVVPGVPSETEPIDPFSPKAPSASETAPVTITEAQAKSYLELSPDEFDSLPRDQRLAAVHILLSTSKNYQENYVGDNDYDLINFNPIDKALSNNDGQSILNQFRYARQLVYAQKQNPADNFDFSINKLNAKHAISAPYYYTMQDEIYPKDVRTMSEFIDNPGLKNVFFNKVSYKIVSTSPLANGTDREGNPIQYKDLVYNVSYVDPETNKPVTDQQSNRFVYTPYPDPENPGKTAYIWQVERDIPTPETTS